jgi:hypothetical protein
VATHPGTPHTSRIRGGAAVIAIVGRARWSVCAHTTQRFVVALTDEGEETSRDLIASDLRGRTLDMVHGQTLRWLVEVLIQDWTSYAGWSQVTKPPGAEGARPSVILSRLVDHRLCVHPDQQTPLQHNLPAYPGGRRRANAPVECLVDVIDDLVSSDHPQDTLQRFTNA